MPLSWALRDALAQLNVLVARKGQLEISETNIRPSARACDLSALSPPDVGKPGALNETDVKASVKLLQSFMLTIINADEIGDACAHLVTLAKQYDSIDHNKDPKAEEAASSSAKAAAPSTRDAAITVDDKKDNSVTFLILDTMVQLLSTVLGLEGFAQSRRLDPFSVDQSPAVIPVSAANLASAHMQGPVVGPDVNPNSIASCPALVPFAFHYLQHIYSSAVRHAACRLMGVLSITFLQPITTLLIEKFALAKKDDAKRAFASYQRCVAFLDFRLAGEKTRCTLDYLSALWGEMKHVDRGVLRQEICSSLDSLYCKILAPNSADPRRETEWNNFVKSEKGVEDWNVLYERTWLASNT
jgi:hypothetical protein